MSTSHYDASYFAWQQSVGKTGAKLEKWKFEPFISPDDSVLDFGCGGGYLISALKCSSRWGVEINPVACAEAAKNINAVRSISDLSPELRFDKIISNHALEHVDLPLAIISELRERLKPGGNLVFVVPSENFHLHPKYFAGDKNQHLHSWTPLTLGNLFARAGYKIDRVELLCNRWPPKAAILMKIFPMAIVRFGSMLFAALTSYREIRITATIE